MRQTLFLLPLLVLALAGAAPDTASPIAVERAVARAFEAKDYAEAATLLETATETWPNRPGYHYNLACAYARLDRTEDSVSALYRAVQAGYRDFEHMQRDPDLASIRDEPMFAAIVEAAGRVAGRRAEDALDRWRRAYGQEHYRFEVDEAHRLAFATALDDVSYREMRAMLEQEADQLIETLFGEPPRDFVLIAVPTPSDAAQIFRGEDGVGGRYEHGQRRLVARDIGGTLRHEFVHALHYGHMERLGIREAHPIWIQEGLAALYEDYRVEPDGTFTFLPNERANVVRRLAKVGRLTRWSELFGMSAERFMRTPGRTYPESRAIFEYLAETGKLTAWYRTYVAGYAEDRTGAIALETVYGRSLDEIERDWREWARDRPAVDTRINTGDASLGVISSPNSGNDGVAVERVVPRSGAARARLRRGDVIVSIDGQPTRALSELQAIIGRKSVGDRVTVRYRRRAAYAVVEVTLLPNRP